MLLSRLTCHLFARLSFDISGPVTVLITRLSKDKGGVILNKDLHADYTTWITQQHNSFDIEAVFNGGVIIPTQEQHKQDLNITNDGEKLSTKEVHHSHEGKNTAFDKHVNEYEAPRTMIYTHA